MKEKLFNCRLSGEAIDAIDKEKQRTGKTKTAIVEDHLLFRRVFGDEAEQVVFSLAAKHKIPPRKVIEVCILKAVGAGGLPFDRLAAA